MKNKQQEKKLVGSKGRKKLQFRKNRQENSSFTGLFSVPTVTGFSLLDINNNLILPVLEEGTVIDLAVLGTKSVVIKIITEPETVGSVDIHLSGALHESKLESLPPYSLSILVLKVGEYSISAIPYSEKNKAGTQGMSATISFRVENSPMAAAPFKIYTNTEWGAQSDTVMAANNIERFVVMTESAIHTETDPYNWIDGRVSRFVTSRFPVPDGKTAANVTGRLSIDWEKGLFKDLLNNPPGTEKFDISEKKMISLIARIRQIRPGIKIGIYNIPAVFSHENQAYINEPEGKWDKLIQLADEINPTYYIKYADEEKSHEFNVNFLIQNLNISLRYGKRLNKPVIPYMSHRIHYLTGETHFRDQIMPYATLADFFRVLNQYTVEGYKCAGAFFWDEESASSRHYNLEGINGWLKDHFGPKLAEYSPLRAKLEALKAQTPPNHNLIETMMPQVEAKSDQLRPLYDEMMAQFLTEIVNATAVYKRMD